MLSPPEHLAALSTGSASRPAARFAALDAEAIEVRLGIEGVRLWQRARADDERWLFKIPLTRRCRARRSSGWSTDSRIPSGCCSSSTRSPARCARRSSQRGERAREMALVFSLGNRTQRTHLDSFVAAERGAEAVDAAGA